MRSPPRAPRARRFRSARHARRRGGDARGARCGRRRPVPLLRGDVGEPGARPGRGGGRSTVRRQVLRLPSRRRLSTGRAGGQRAPGAGGARTRRDRREPELLHDPADVRPEAPPRRGGARARAGLDLPVGFRRRRPADGCPSARGARRARPRHGLGLGRRRVRRGVEAPRRDPEDPRAPRPSDLRDLRPRAGDGRPLRGGLGRARATADARGRRRAPPRGTERACARPALVPDARRRRRHRRGARGQDPARHRGRERPRAVPLERQPPQGRRPERDPDRGAAA